MAKPILKFLNKEDEMLERSVEMGLFIEASDVRHVLDIDMGVDAEKTTKHLTRDFLEVGREGNVQFRWENLLIFHGLLIGSINLPSMKLFQCEWSGLVK